MDRLLNCTIGGTRGYGTNKQTNYQNRTHDKRSCTQGSSNYLLADSANRFEPGNYHCIKHSTVLPMDGMWYYGTWYVHTKHHLHHTIYWAHPQLYLSSQLCPSSQIDLINASIHPHEYIIKTWADGGPKTMGQDCPCARGTHKVGVTSMCREAHKKPFVGSSA